MPSLGGDQYKWYCEIPPLAEPGNYPGGVKTKPPFEMGVDDLETKIFIYGIENCDAEQ